MQRPPNDSPSTANKTNNMKHIHILTAIVFTTITLQAHENILPGPNGGRLLTTTQPHAEFLVTPERKVQITFVGEDGKPIPAAAEVVTITTGDRSAPVKLTFSKVNGPLLSNETLPEGNNFPVVVQIKPTPEAKAALAKFTLNVTPCPGCQKPEYACTCSH